jgi:hypothetical protein
MTTTSNTIEAQLREIATMSTEALVARYMQLTGKEPRRNYARWLRKRVAWLIQENAFGGLSVAAKRRITELQRTLELPLDLPGAEENRPAGLMVGTTIEREWRGQKIRVEVLRDGFEWNGERFTSLSALATRITGTRWNGRLFFGLPKETR